MLPIVLSAFFAVMAVRGALNPLGEKRFDSFFWVMTVFAVGLAVLPIRQALFEAKLETAVEKLTHRYGVSVICHSRLGSFFHWNKLGYVKLADNAIHLRPDMCSELRRYIADPAEANKTAIRHYDTVLSLHVLTHEAMHVNQEYNEVKADCQAYQRNHKMAVHLGVKPKLAAQSAIVIHRFRRPHHPYYSTQCEPGSALDEKLIGAVWRGPDN